MSKVAILLFPRFQMLAFVLVTETLRIANKVAGETLFQWEILTAGDALTAASNGMLLGPDRPIAEAGEVDLLLVCAGYEPLKQLDAGSIALLRRHARAGRALGGLDTGTVILAKLGLLSGYRAALHWEAEAGFREEFPDITIEDSIYCLDRDRLTAAGGMSTGDAMLSWIAQQHSPQLAAAVALDLVHGRIRPMEERQRPVPGPVDDSGLAQSIRLMRQHIENPLPIETIARRSGLKLRRMLELFRRVCAQTPSEYYLGLRLEHARDMLGATDLPIARVGLASGFASPAWFSRAYRGRFGVSPARHRRLMAAATEASLTGRPILSRHLVAALPDHSGPD